MTGVAYLKMIEHMIITEGQIVDHNKWPCRKKQWNELAKNGGIRNNDNSGMQYVGDKDYYQSDSEFFIIEEMMNNDYAMRSKKLFLLYIKMEHPTGDIKDAASVAWTPLAKVLQYPLLNINVH
jgi:hypothetical protein